MSQISRLRNAEIANGNLINADDIAAELNQLVTESNSQDTRLDSLESGNIIISGNKTFSGNATFSGTTGFSSAVTLSGTIALSGQTNVARAADPVSPNNGDFWYNSTGNALKGRINGNTLQIATLNDLGAFPPGHHGSAPPVYINATTFSMAKIQERDSGNTANLVKTAGTTVDITTTGLNGLAQSANLGGTVSVSASGTFVTGSGTTFTGTFQVGDVLTTAGAQSRLITAIASDTALTVATTWTSTESAVTYKRGGRGASSNSAGLHFYLYAISDGTTPGLILSTRNVAKGDILLDLPTGYTLSSQLAFAVRLDTSANLTPFTVISGWPRRPKIMLDVNPNSAPWQLISGGTVSTWTALDCSAITPGIAVAADFNGYAIHNSTSGYNFGFIRPGGSSSAGRIMAYTGAPNNSPTAHAINIADVPLSSGRTVEYQAAGTNGPAITLGLTAFTVEVP
jgi:hypothetical protein